MITINAISREPGYRSKVAVSSIDSKVDCVGACVGVRGNRIKVIIDELAGERIDIVRFDEEPMEMIPNALQPAEVDEVILCQKMGRAIVLVREDQLSLAIGKRGQNVRLASKLCKWDIEIMTQGELEQQIERAVQGFVALKGVDEDLANSLVGEGYLDYDDLSVIEPVDLMEMGGISEAEVDAIVEQAETLAEEAEVREAQEKRAKKAAADEARRLDAIQRAQPQPATPAAPAKNETAISETANSEPSSDQPSPDAAADNADTNDSSKTSDSPDKGSAES